MTDFVPQIITLIDVSELGQNLQTVVGQNRFRGNFLSGETIQYSSVASDPFTIDETNIPKALQLSMIAVNSAGAELVLSALIVYSNSCTDYPVFLGGAGIGWAGLVRNELSCTVPPRYQTLLNSVVSSLLTDPGPGTGPSALPYSTFPTNNSANYTNFSTNESTSDSNFTPNVCPGDSDVCSNR